MPFSQFKDAITPTCINVKTTPQALNSGAAADIVFTDADANDSMGVHDHAGGNPERFIITQAGLYEYEVEIIIIGAAGQETLALLTLAGALVKSGVGFGSATINSIVHLSGKVYCAIGNTFVLNVEQTNTGASAQNLIGSMRLYKIGDNIV